MIKMNRAERRRLEKNGVNKGTIMKQYGEEAFEAGRKAGMKEATEIIFYMTAWTIQYKLGFGRKRLQTIMWQIFNNIDCFRTGHLYPDDFPKIKEEMQEKYGIRLS